VAYTSKTAKVRNALSMILASALFIVQATAVICADPPDAVEQIPDGLVGEHGDTPIRIWRDEVLMTKDSFRPPIEITIVAKTDSTNLRLGYAADQVIFNWEVDENQLRIDGGPADGQHQMNKGHIPKNEFVTIRWVVTKTQQSIYVNDDLRFQNSADYSNINKPISIFGSHGSILRVESLKTRQLKDSDSESSSAFGATSPAASSPSPPTPEHEVATVKLTEDQARAVVLIKGDNAEGTGFLVKTSDGPIVVTNIHVISNNPNLKITTNTGSPITILSYKGADDRDMAMIAVKDGDFKYLTLATDIGNTVQPGDEVITPGNSEGGEVVLNTDGKVLGIGPDRIEFDNPIYHGNSGGPVFHVKSGKVIGVVTEAVKVDVSDELDKTSFASRNSAIGGSMRYFGFRIDNVPNWEAYDWRRFQNETAFLDQFDKRSRCLDCYINAPNDNKPEDTLWQEDPKIARANSDFFDQASGADTSQQLNADRIMWAEFSDIAGIDMDTIQNPNNFYSFDRQRAKDEIAYRKALKAELDEISNNVNRLGSLPRTNNQ
jgi:S1-C subfamily serine protease